MNASLRGLSLVASLGLSAVGCAGSPPPVTTASGEQVNFAERYPAQLTGIRARFKEDEAQVKTFLSEFGSATEKLTSADPATLAALYERADEEGRSGAYADAALADENVARFIEEERGPLHQKVAGAVNYAAKQKECAEDLGSTAAAAMDRAIDKQLEERLEEVGEVHRFVEDHEERLGKPSADAAEKQAQALARASYVSHVRLELHRRELEGMVSEASSVRRTLERSQRENDDILADKQRPRPKRALAEKRRAAAASALGSLDAEVEQSRRAATEMEQRERDLTKSYDATLRGVLDALEKRKK